MTILRRDKGKLYPLLFYSVLAVNPDILIADSIQMECMAMRLSTEKADWVAN